MIGYLKGKIIDRDIDKIILNVSGVGYEVNIPSNINFTEDETELFIYNHVREDQFSLFGFLSKDDMLFFKNLLSVSGIGPKVALSIIGSASINSLKDSISSGDPSMLSAVSGVGKKTAEKAVIELKGKLGFIGTDGYLKDSGAEEIVEALLGLGFQRSEIIDGLKRVPGEINDNDEKIKWLVKNLGRK